jgi:hypothetical protein
MNYKKYNWKHHASLAKDLKDTRAELKDTKGLLTKERTAKKALQSEINILKDDKIPF